MAGLPVLKNCCHYTSLIGNVPEGKDVYKGVCPAMFGIAFAAVKVADAVLVPKLHLQQWMQLAAGLAFEYQMARLP